MGKIVMLNSVRERKFQAPAELEYQAKILRMDKVQLLEEMIRFQNEKIAQKGLSPSLVSQGLYLFKVLGEKAETTELKDLTRAYRRHLRLEQAILKA